ncbi:MAG: hypothetical protein MHM6MM_004302 [Cercozoa sp. M6MM]
MSQTQPHHHEEHAPKEHFEPKRRILIALDHSLCSKHAFDWILSNSVKPESDQLVLIHVLEVDAVMPVAGPGGAVLMHWEALRREEIARGKQLLHALTERLKEQGIHYIAKIISGDARSVLVEQCNEHNASLLVVGSRGRGAIARTLLGSVSDYLVHHAPCPIAVVREGMGAKEAGTEEN